MFHRTTEIASAPIGQALAKNASPPRYQVVDAGTGDRFGNHTYAEACSRAQVMRRNWNYKKVFVVEQAQP